MGDVESRAADLHGAEHLEPAPSGRWPGPSTIGSWAGRAASPAATPSVSTPWMVAYPPRSGLRVKPGDERSGTPAAPPRESERIRPRKSPDGAAAAAAFGPRLGVSSYGSRRGVAEARQRSMLPILRSSSPQSGRVSQTVGGGIELAGLDQRLRMVGYGCAGATCGPRTNGDRNRGEQRTGPRRP